MSRKPLVLIVLLFTVATALNACARAPNPRNEESASNALVPATAALPQVVVHKRPSCGCCALWVEHLRKSGFTVDVRHEDKLNPIKTRVGVPAGKGSCHTAVVGGYFIEGHVPAQDIKRLLAEKPDIKGLTLPGMPIGSPGMEMPGGTTQAYTVEQVGRDGTTTAFAKHAP